MDTNTAMVYVAVIVAAVATLLILWGHDFEGGGRTGYGEFFFKTRKRRRRR